MNQGATHKKKLMLLGGLRTTFEELCRLNPCIGLRKLPSVLQRDNGIMAEAKLILPLARVPRCVAGLIQRALAV